MRWDIILLSGSMMPALQTGVVQAPALYHARGWCRLTIWQMLGELILNSQIALGVGLKKTREVLTPG